MPDLNIRKLDQATLDRFRRGAAARGITQAEYLERLLRFQETMQSRSRHAGGEYGEAVTLELESLGLEPVTA